MHLMCSLISIFFILSESIHEIFGQTANSQTVGDNIMYAACGKLCDKPDIDAIAPLSVPTDKQFLVIIVRDGLCSWVLDMNDPKQNRDWGRRHHFKYDLVESLYTIFDEPKSSDKFNVTALFTSGMVSETWRSVNGFIKKDSDGPLPLLGLGYNMQKEIDASYGWQPDPQFRIVNIIQNDTYYSFDLKKKRKLFGPNSLTKDFSYDYKKSGKVQGAFSRGKDIYFFSGANGYYIWKSKDGKTGVMSEKLSVIKDFYNCGTRYTTLKPNYLTEPDIPQEEGGSDDEPSISSDYPNSDGLTESDLRNDIIESYETSGEVVSDSVIGFPKSRTTEEVDINVEPKTVKASVDYNGGLSGADYKVLLSIKLFVVFVMILILEYIPK